MNAVVLGKLRQKLLSTDSSYHRDSDAIYHKQKKDNRPLIEIRSYETPFPPILKALALY